MARREDFSKASADDLSRQDRAGNANGSGDLAASHGLLFGLLGWRKDAALPVGASDWDAGQRRSGLDFDADRRRYLRAGASSPHWVSLQRTCITKREISCGDGNRVG
jgi:hypothetical protein